MDGISLIVGLGNPGDKYRASRHNAGFWLLQRLLQRHAGELRPESRFKGAAGSVVIGGQPVRLLAPKTFMNLSGEAVAPFAGYFRIPPQRILVVHDELDLPPGAVRLKLGGGHGGHNGLRDIVARLGSSDFARLRIGIGRPPENREVVSFVLRPPPESERLLIEAAIDRALEELPEIVAGKFQAVMNSLHGPERGEG
ncbi:MAG: aminoacyl-tRNA hydrolase [Pseudomonadota bacterium]|nr:aminoacyl-tRNA hydrolase [Pseudomonadota bacterium]